MREQTRNKEEGYCHLRFHWRFSWESCLWEGCYHWSRTPPVWEKNANKSWI